MAPDERPEDAAAVEEQVSEEESEELDDVINAETIEGADDVEEEEEPAEESESHDTEDDEEPAADEVGICPVARLLERRCGARSLTARATLLQALASPSRKEIAQKEKERLRQQAKAKKEMLEKMRQDQNQDSTNGDVSACGGPLIMLCTYMS
jgi:hypothetical protein